MSGCPHSCACNREDAYDCALDRCAGGPPPVDVEPCECVCHEAEEDNEAEEANAYNNVMAGASKTKIAAWLFSTPER